MTSISPKLLVILALGFGCADNSDFKGSVATGKGYKAPATADVEVGKDSIDADPEVSEHSKDFELKKESMPVDMVWVIDNSGSMAEEAAQVRVNFTSFMSSVSGRTDLKVTVISDQSSRYGIVLDPAVVAQGHSQIVQTIGSTNLLGMAASAMCPPESTTMDSSGVGTICGLDGLSAVATTVLGGGIRRGNGELRSVGPVKGALQSRMREGAKKVFVFVTDDNNQGFITESNFIAAIKTDAMNTHVFAFRGDQSKSGCGVANKGASYEALAATSGGEVFDICETDWSANFAKLSSNIIKLASTAFRLEGKGTVAIKKVLLDGAELPPSAYAASGSLVTLTDDSVALKGSKLTVVYTVAN